MLTAAPFTHFSILWKYPTGMYAKHTAQWMVIKWTHPCHQPLDEGKEMTSPWKPHLPSLSLHHPEFLHIGLFCLLVCFINMDSYTRYLVWLPLFSLKGWVKSEAKRPKIGIPPTHPELLEENCLELEGCTAPELQSIITVTDCIILWNSSINI